MALGSRGDPPLHLGRLRAQGKLLELRAPELAMAETEGAQLFAEAGLTLDAAEVHTLVSRTEGWPVGLYLASLALRDQADVGRAVANFAGDDRIVTDYVRDELLSQLSPARIRFLMRTSVLDRLSGPLCDAVLERSGSSNELRAMSRANLLLVPLDRTDEWYRYHTLLLDTLRDELHRREPEREDGAAPARQRLVRRSRRPRPRDRSCPCSCRRAPRGRPHVGERPAVQHARASSRPSSDGWSAYRTRRS